MPEVWPGGDEIIVHDFRPDYYCGRCWIKMDEHRDMLFECACCHLAHVAKELVYL